MKIKFDELNNIHSECERRISILRAGASPSLQELDILTSRLIELEEKSRQRNKPTNLASNPDQSVEIEFELYKKRVEEHLKQKNAEISRFRTELDGLLDDISLLKQNLM